MRKNIKESGFSLLELLLVIGVGSLILLGGLATYRIVTQGNNINEVIRLTNAAKISIQSMYGNQADYGTDGDDFTTVAVRGGAFPPKNVSGTTPNDPWGEAIIVEAADEESFIIQLQNLPEAACIQLAVAFTPSTDSDFVSVSINGNTQIENPQVSDADGECAAGDTNSIAWEFI